MTITITLPSPNSNLGPGSLLQWITDHALGTTPRFLIDLSGQSDFLNPWWHVLFTTASQAGLANIGFGVSGPILSQFQTAGVQIAEGGTAYLRVRLMDGTSVIETATATPAWQQTADLKSLMELMFEAHPAGAALTPTQATQLQNASDNSDSILTGITSTVTSTAGAITQTLGELFTQHTLDEMTLINATPGGPTGSPVTYDISGQWINGVIVRIASYPPGTALTTPDEFWTYSDFAVLRIFRGTDLVKRVPIHSPSHMEFPLPGYAFGLIGDFMLGTQPPWSSIQVDFAPGVTGSVYLMVPPA